MHLRALLLLLALLALGACQLSPDSNSGDDRFRHLAKPIPFGDWDMDQLSYGESDRTDWKKFDVPDDGELKLELQCKNADAAVLLALHDGFGRLLDKVQKIPGDSRPLLVTQTVTAGRHFVMLQAVDDTDETEYSFKVSFE
jgi:hypothetical protein